MRRLKRKLRPPEGEAFLGRWWRNARKKAELA
jgi:hypothetical protein